MKMKHSGGRPQILCLRAREPLNRRRCHEKTAASVRRLSYL